MDIKEHIKKMIEIDNDLLPLREKFILKLVIKILKKEIYVK